MMDRDDKEVLLLKESLPLFGGNTEGNKEGNTRGNTKGNTDENTEGRRYVW